MHAIVRVAGVQARVSPGDRILFPRLDAEVGSTMTFDDVLLVSDGENTVIGTPVVDGVRVEAEVLEHARDKKIVVFKKKRRKRYRRTNGHRQRYTAVQITGIVGPETVKETERAASAETVAEPTPEAPVEENAAEQAE